MNSPRFDPSRLAEDHALAVEAQDEMKNIITKFVDLLKEEEQQLEVQAGERNTYMCILDTVRFIRDSLLCLRSFIFFARFFQS